MSETLSRKQESFAKIRNILLALKTEGRITEVTHNELNTALYEISPTEYDWFDALIERSESFTKDIGIVVNGENKTLKLSIEPKG